MRITAEAVRAFPVVPTARSQEREHGLWNGARLICAYSWDAGYRLTVKIILHTMRLQTEHSQNCPGSVCVLPLGPRGTEAQKYSVITQAKEKPYSRFTGLGLC